MGKANLEQKITLVTGKGGVGKSTIAAALALNLARQGRRVLLTEFSETSYFSRVTGKPVTYKPEEWHPNLWVSTWDGVNALREFLLYYVRLEGVVNLFFDNKVMKSLVRAAPALKELALLGKLTSGIRGIGPDLDFDDIVVDAFATGHFKALLEVPRGMGELIRFGPMGEQSRGIHKVLSNAESTRIVCVTLPEELPVTETLELCADLEKADFKNVRVICNRVLQLPLAKEQMQQLEDEASGGLKDFLKFTSSWQLRQEQSLENLKALGRAFATLPFLFEKDPQKRIEQLCQAAGDVWKI